MNAFWFLMPLNFVFFVARICHCSEVRRSNVVKLLSEFLVVIGKQKSIEIANFVFKKAEMPLLNINDDTYKKALTSSDSCFTTINRRKHNYFINWIKNALKKGSFDSEYMRFSFFNMHTFIQNLEQNSDESFRLVEANDAVLTFLLRRAIISYYANKKISCAIF